MPYFCAKKKKLILENEGKMFWTSNYLKTKTNKILDWWSPRPSITQRYFLIQPKRDVTFKNASRKPSDQRKARGNCDNKKWTGSK